jgi:L-alanine-DL-glutamate epimerase-like enolase superfamily enzyme
MKIDAVEVGLYGVPPHRTMSDSIQALTQIQLIVVGIRTDDGAEGLGYSYTIGVGGSAAAAFARDELTPLLLGQPALDTEALWQRLWWGTNSVGRGGLGALGRAAVDIALWDLKARAANLPLARLLGGARDRLPVYTTDGGWLNFPPEQLVEEATAAVARGFTGIKIKVGKPSAAEDARRVAAVRQAIGPDVALMVDANQAWTAAEAIRRAEHLAEFDLAWLEEPLIADDVGGHARVRQAVRVPLAVGETLYSSHAFREYVERGAVDIMQPDVGRIGGVTEWLRVAHLAAAWNLPVAPHYLMELHLHLAAAVPNAIWVEHIPSLDAVLAEPLRLTDGHYTVPDRTGHGILFDWDRLEGYRLG